MQQAGFEGGDNGWSKKSLTGMDGFVLSVIAYGEFLFILGQQREQLIDRMILYDAFGRKLTKKVIK